MFSDQPSIPLSWTTPCPHVGVLSGHISRWEFVLKNSSSNVINHKQGETPTVNRNTTQPQGLSIQGLSGIHGRELCGLILIKARALRWVILSSTGGGHSSVKLELYPGRTKCRIVFIIEKALRSDPPCLPCPGEAEQEPTVPTPCLVL